jgi:3',5'-cyclic AMP phosphodiesterase CpdA
VNLLLQRAKTHRVEVVQQAMTQILDLGIDHLVVTGDLSNLSLDAEFRLAKAVLARFGDGHKVSVIPGNHDCYTYAAGRERRFESHFAAYMQSDLPQFRADDTYPYVKLRDGLALVGLSSAVATPPLFATGCISDGQLDKLAQLLQHDDVKSRSAVVLVHHHLKAPPYRRVDRWRRLVNAGALSDVLRAGNVQLVLHGHNHRPLMWRLSGDNGAATGPLVVEAGSTSAIPHGGEEKAGKFNVYDWNAGRLERITTYTYRGDEHAGTFAVWSTAEMAGPASP